ncbi:SWI2/SNF2 ISWI-like (AT hook), partial [Toxoplasma gondii ARI]
ASRKGCVCCPLEFRLRFFFSRRGDGGAAAMAMVKKERKLSRKTLTGWRAEINGGYDFQFFNADQLDALDAIQRNWQAYLDNRRRKLLETLKRERDSALALAEGVKKEVETEKGQDAEEPPAKKQKTSAGDKPETPVFQKPTVADLLRACRENETQVEGGDASWTQGLRHLSVHQAEQVERLLESFASAAGLSLSTFEPRHPEDVEMEALPPSGTVEKICRHLRCQEGEHEYLFSTSAPSFAAALQQLAEDLVGGRAEALGVLVAVEAARRFAVPTSEAEPERQGIEREREEMATEEEAKEAEGKEAEGKEEESKDATKEELKESHEESEALAPEAEDDAQGGEEDESEKPSPPASSGSPAAGEEGAVTKKKAGRPRKNVKEEERGVDEDEEDEALLALLKEEDLDDENDPERPEEFTEEMRKEKERLLAEGFGHWNRTEFSKFVSGLIHYGRDRLAEAWCAHFRGTTKSLEDLERYTEVFCKRYSEVEGGDRIMQRVEKAADIRGALDSQRRAVQAMVEEQLREETAGNGASRPIERPDELRLPKRLAPSTHFTPQEDSMLLWGLYEQGVTAYAAIHALLKYYWFDSRGFFHVASRSMKQVEDRCKEIVMAIELEETAKTGQKECMRYRQFRPTSHRIGRPPTRLSAGGRPGRGHASHLSRSREKNGDALVFPGDEGEEGRSVCWENEEGEERREGRTDGMAFDTARNADGRGGSHKSRRCTGRKRGRPRGGRGRSSTRGLAPTHLTGDSGTGAGLGSGESDRGGEEQELRHEGDENESGREDVREKEEEKDGDEHGKLVA